MNDFSSEFDDTPPELSDIIMNLSDHTTDPDRPFTGQSHTDQGERGKTEIKGIRFRDLADCVVKAFVDSTPGVSDVLRERANDGTLNYNDLYELDLTKMSPIALIQNINCRVGEAMGIYLNIPKGVE